MSETSRLGSSAFSRSRSERIARSARKASVPLTSTTGAGRTLCQSSTGITVFAAAATRRAYPRPPSWRRSLSPHPHRAAVAGGQPDETRRVGAPRGRADAREQVEGILGRMPVRVVGADADEPGRRVGARVKLGVLVGRAVVGDLDDVDARQ